MPLADGETLIVAGDRAVRLGRRHRRRGSTGSRVLRRLRRQRARALTRRPHAARRRRHRLGRALVPLLRAARRRARPGHTGEHDAARRDRHPGAGRASSSATRAPGAATRAAYRYAWTLDGAPVAGFTGRELLLEPADLGRALRCAVTRRRRVRDEPARDRRGIAAVRGPRAALADGPATPVPSPTATPTPTPGPPIRHRRPRRRRPTVSPTPTPSADRDAAAPTPDRDALAEPGPSRPRPPRPTRRRAGRVRPARPRSPPPRVIGGRSPRRPCRAARHSSAGRCRGRGSRSPSARPSRPRSSAARATVRRTFTLAAGRHTLTAAAARRARQAPARALHAHGAGPRRGGQRRAGARASLHRVNAQPASAQPGGARAPRACSSGVRCDLPDALDAMGGLQAQYAPSMYIGLWSRVADLRRDARDRGAERARDHPGDAHALHDPPRVGGRLLAAGARDPRRAPRLVAAGHQARAAGRAGGEAARGPEGRAAAAQGDRGGDRQGRDAGHRRVGRPGPRPAAGHVGEAPRRQLRPRRGLAAAARGQRTRSGTWSRAT